MTVQRRHRQLFKKKPHERGCLKRLKSRWADNKWRYSSNAHSMALFFFLNSICMNKHEIAFSHKHIVTWNANSFDHIQSYHLMLSYDLIYKFALSLCGSVPTDGVINPSLLSVCPVVRRGFYCFNYFFLLIRGGKKGGGDNKQKNKQRNINKGTNRQTNRTPRLVLEMNFCMDMPIRLIKTSKT